VTSTPPDTLAYRAPAALPAGVSVERGEDGGITVSVLPLPPRRRLWLGAASVVAIFLGPAAAAVMLAAGLGWVGPLLVLALLLAPAILLRLAVISLEHEPPEGPEVVFRLDADDLEVRVFLRGGERVKRWPRRDVDSVRPGWLGNGLVVRAAGRVGTEVMPWHPRPVRAAVARLLEGEIHTGRQAGGPGYNRAGGDAPVRPTAPRRPGPFV
jgi:hypothetical protein